MVVPISVAVCLLVAAPARGGERDTHLTATHYLARRAGFDEAQAALIARADWSMDLNLSTTALPVVDPDDRLDDHLTHTNRALPALYYERGSTYHALGPDPEHIAAKVETLRRAIPPPGQGDERARLLAVGQYLHAVQDVYFHQHDGVPYGSRVGHARTASDRRADVVALHYDAALLAQTETARILDAVAAGREIPAPDWAHAYEKRPHPLPAAFAAQFDPEIRSLASAIARSYPRDETKPDPKKLEANLHAVWRGPEPYVPFVALSHAPEHGKIIYDTNPQLLRVKPGAPEPGGISFSAAAAAGLPIDVELDALAISGDRIVLGGRRSRGYAFDAAELLTALRLACLHGDPYFSLDPVDGLGWRREGDDAWRAAWRAHRNAFLDAPDPSESETVGEPRVHTGVYEGETVSRGRPQLASRLVFYPEWLRTTRAGKILYDADVLLKALASGRQVVREGGTIAAPRLTGYHSADERDAVARLFESVTGKASRQPGGEWRLWFDLQDRGESKLLPIPPAIPPSSEIDKLIAREAAPAALDERAALADQVRAQLRAKGLAPEQLDVRARPAAVVAVDGAAMDLSSVYPRMFVRRHDFVTGHDTGDADPELAAVAADVNARIEEWSRQYVELRALVELLRAYVAGVHLVDRDRALCASIDALPILPSEKLDAPLPMTRPSVVTIESVALRVARRQGDRNIVERLVGVGGGIQGGVALEVKSASTGALAFRTRSTDRTRAALAALDGPAPDDALVLSLDLAQAAAEAASFEPVTEEDVLGADQVPVEARRREAPPTPDLRTRARRFIVSVLSVPVLGSILGMLLTVAAFLLLGAVQVALESARDRLFGKRR